MISQYGSMQFDGVNPSKLPDGDGDLFYEADRIRDFAYLLDRAGSVLVDLVGQNAVLISSGGVAVVDPTHVNIGASVGYAPFTVDLGTSGAVPPATGTEDINALRIASVAANGVLLTGGVQGNVNANATLNGVAVNYVKMKYAEAAGLTRQRAKTAGTWSFTKTPSWAITIDTVAPTAYEVLLATLVGNGTSTLNVTPVPALSEAQRLDDLRLRLRMEVII